MKFVKTKTFEKDYVSLPAKIHKRVDKQLKFLATNLRHPQSVPKRLKALKIFGKVELLIPAALLLKLKETRLNFAILLLTIKLLSLLSLSIQFLRC